MDQNQTIEIQKELFSSKGNLAKYQDLVLGTKGIFKLLKYETIIGIASWMPGALGLVLRKSLYPKLLGSAGRNVTFGQNVVLRHPEKIFIGSNVVIDDNCVLDAKGTGNHGIYIGNGVFIGRNTILNCKNGDIILEDEVNISANCHIFSASRVRVGASNLFAAYTYLVGGTHHFDNPSIPVLHQSRSSEGITIGPGGWLGAHVSVFDGVNIGRNVIVGAGSVVNKDLPDYAVAVGSPAKVLKKREPPEEGTPPVPVTIGIINYNGEKVLGKTLDAIYKQDCHGISEIIAVDNSSTDNSLDVLKSKFPDVKIISMENRGPNPSRNLILKEAAAPRVLLVDNDIVLAPDALSKLNMALDSNPDAGVASAQIRFFNSPEKIQYNGAHIHFAGGAVMNRFMFDVPRPVAAVPAGAMLVDKAKAEEIGYFDEDFFYGWADGDFSFRMTIAGYPCLNVAGARVFHLKEKKGMPWVFYQVRNRWWFVLKTYNLRTLFFTLPAIFLYQGAVFFGMLLKGQGWPVIKGGFAALWSLPLVLRKRREVMKIKRVRDKDVLTGASIDLIGEGSQSKIIKMGTGIMNAVLKIYWVLVKRFIN
ncbi:glycosyltransferase [bacterium]|nr:glycosyltransferase [bacterium]